MKKDYDENIKSILEDGLVEGIKVDTDILKLIFNDEELYNLLYEKFEDVYLYDDLDMLYSKTQDMVYRMHLLVNNYIISDLNIKDIDSIKTLIKQMIEKNVDLYSAVSYDENDKEIIDEFNDLYYESDIQL